MSTLSEHYRKRTHCKNGHAFVGAVDSSGNRMCKVCRDKRAVAWYKRHPKVKQQVGAAYHKKNSKEIREYDLKRKGWTSQRVLECTAQQHNCCAICKEEFLETPCSDHKHVVPPIPRGLLCQFCNRGLGMFKDRSDLCKAAAEYLEKYNAVRIKGTTEICLRQS